MKIPSSGPKPSDKGRRLNFFVDTVEKCRVSRVERMQQYSSWRLYWLFGSDGSYENEDTDLGLGPPPGNKIWPHIEQLSSFLYAQDTTRFSLRLGAQVKKPFQAWVPKINQVVNDEWHNSNTDIIYGVGLTLALVYGCTFLKPLWKKNGIQPHIALPHNMGFLNEGIGQISRQEAFCHWYTITASKFRNDYTELLGGEANTNATLDRLSKISGGTPIESQEAGLDRIIMSAQDPLGTQGNPGGGQAVVDWLAAATNNYVPRTKEQLIEMTELYVWDDKLNDFRIITLADPEVPIIDRPLSKTGWLTQECPFVQIVPNPDLGYIHGISEVERLVPLQTQRNRIMAQIEHLQELQAHSPMTQSGFPGDPLEIQNVLDTPYGVLNNPDGISQGGGSPKADRVKIEISSDIYARLDRNDQQFEDMSGLPPVTQGKNPPGVRAGGHASELAKLGSSRARKRAMMVEDGLEAAATVYLKLMRKYDDTPYEAPVTAEQPEMMEEFVLDQLPDDFTVEVDAHSNSPIFVDDQTALAFQLFKSKAINRRALLERVPVSGRQQLLADLEVIEKQEQAAAQQQMKLEQARAQGKRPQGRPRRVGNGGQPATQ